jgi:hypothetical protein
LDAVECLPIAGVDRYLALAVLGRIIERSGLEDDGVSYRSHTDRRDFGS